MNIVESLKKEFIVIMSILIFGAIAGFKECKDFWNYDIGTCISAIGMLWTVGSFFRIYSNMGSNVASLFVGISVFLLGFAIGEYGIFTAFIIVGCAFLYFAYLCQPLAPIQAAVIFLVGLVLIPVGLLLRPFDIPTYPEKSYHPITITNMDWDIFLYYHGDVKGTNIAHVIGTEEYAYREARKSIISWKSNNPALHIREAQIRVDDSRLDEAKAEGHKYTHQLFKLGDFPKNRIPKYCDLTDLEN